MKWKGVGEITSTPKPPLPPAILPFVTDSFGILAFAQVYKYREHIYFLQQKFKQEGTGSQPVSPMFDMPGPSQGNNLSRLYGSTATQYINEMLLQGNTPPKFPASPIPDGKKPLVGKHSDGSGKPWQFQQVRDENVRRLNYNIKTNKQTKRHVKF